MATLINSTISNYKDGGDLEEPNRGMLVKLLGSLHAGFVHISHTELSVGCNMPGRSRWEQVRSRHTTLSNNWASSHNVRVRGCAAVCHVTHRACVSLTRYWTPWPEV